MEPGIATITKVILVSDSALFLQPPSHAFLLPHPPSLFLSVHLSHHLECSFSQLHLPKAYAFFKAQLKCHALEIYLHSITSFRDNLSCSGTEIEKYLGLHANLQFSMLMYSPKPELKTKSENDL